MEDEAEEEEELRPSRRISSELFESLASSFVDLQRGHDFTSSSRREALPERLQRQQRRRRSRIVRDLDVSRSRQHNAPLLDELNALASAEHCRQERQRVERLEARDAAVRARARQQRVNRKRAVMNANLHTVPRAVAKLCVHVELPSVRDDRARHEEQQRQQQRLQAADDERIMRQVRKFKQIDIYPKFAELPRLRPLDALPCSLLYDGTARCDALPVKPRVESYAKGIRHEFLCRLRSQHEFGVTADVDLFSEEFVDVNAPCTLLPTENDIDDGGDGEGVEQQTTMWSMAETPGKLIELAASINERLVKSLKERFAPGEFDGRQWTALSTLMPLTCVRDVRSHVESGGGGGGRRRMSVFDAAVSHKRVNSLGHSLIEKARQRLDWRHRQHAASSHLHNDNDAPNATVTVTDTDNNDGSAQDNDRQLTPEQQQQQQQQQQERQMTPGVFVSGQEMLLPMQPGAGSVANANVEHWFDSAPSGKLSMAREGLKLSSPSSMFGVDAFAARQQQKLLRRFDWRRYMALFNVHQEPEQRFRDVAAHLEMDDDVRDQHWSFYVDMDDERVVDVVAYWETATAWLLMREDLLIELALFESVASHPWRLFLGPSTARLHEEMKRTLLHTFIERISTRLTESCSVLRENCFAELTFKGEVYEMKMRSDVANVSREMRRLELMTSGADPEQNMLLQARGVLLALGAHERRGVHRHKAAQALLNALPAIVNPFYGDIVRKRLPDKPKPSSLVVAEVVTPITSPRPTLLLPQLPAGSPPPPKQNLSIVAAFFADQHGEENI